MKLGDLHCARCNVCNWHVIRPCESGGLVLHTMYKDHQSVLEVSDTVTEVRRVTTS